MSFNFGLHGNISQLTTLLHLMMAWWLNAQGVKFVNQSIPASRSLKLLRLASWLKRKIQLIL